MFGEKKYAALATLVGLAILGAVAVPALIASSAAAQITPPEQGAGNQTSAAATGGNNSFSSSVNISPTADSNAKVTIEGNGLTARQVNVNQERQADGTVKITVEGVFAVGGEAAPVAPSGGIGTSGQAGNNETTTSPAPSGSETSSTMIPPANETSLPPTLAPLAGVFPSSGAAGSQVNISGSGFTPNQALTFSFDGSSLDAGSMTTDSAGTFSANATVPTDAASGDHEVKVTDGTGASTTTRFTVESASTGQAGNQTGNETSTTQSNMTATVPPGNETTTPSTPFPQGNETIPSGNATAPSGNETSTTPVPSGNETTSSGNATGPTIP
ncbi:MAG: hypothetical protein ABI348_08840 [Nitrososphaera sp.]